MDLNLLFTLANVYVLPFWLLMIVLPNWEITKKVMQSYLVFLPLIILYIYLFVGALDPESIGLLASPELPGIAQAFGSEGVAFTGWSLLNSPYFVRKKRSEFLPIKIVKIVGLDFKKCRRFLNRFLKNLCSLKWISDAVLSNFRCHANSVDTVANLVHNAKKKYSI